MPCLRPAPDLGLDLPMRPELRASVGANVQILPGLGQPLESSYHDPANGRFAVETRREAAGCAEKYDKAKQRCIKGCASSSNCRTARSTQTCPTRPVAQAALLQPGVSALQSLLDEVAHRQGLPEAAARGAQIRRIVKLWVLRSRRHETGYFVS